MHKLQGGIILLGLLLAGAGLLAVGSRAGSAAQTDSRFFPETGHTVAGRFLRYWDNHGGLAQQGYPLSDEFSEISTTDGKTYTVQYFERAVFEYHPEYAGTPAEVLLSLSGVDANRQRYPQGAPDQHPHPDGILFPETGHKLGGSFRNYWLNHGGLAQQGYPISDEFIERSVLDGNEHTVQYFERAVFEYHPENKGTAYEVLLAQLGTYRYRVRYQTLAIPTPPVAWSQYNPQSSDRYLAWVEHPTGSVQGNSRIRALDIQTRQALTVTDIPRDLTLGNVSGSLVVWTDRGPGCPPDCATGDVQAKDLATGQLYDVASGPNNQHDPSIAGRTVVWLENNGYGVQVLAKDLDSTNITPLATASGPIDSFAPPLVSANYIVWVRLHYLDITPSVNQVQITAYNRQTRDIQDIAEYVIPGERLPRYALEGDQFVWLSADGLQLVNLAQGTQHPSLYNGPGLFAGNPFVTQVGVHNDALYWVVGGLVYGVLTGRGGVVLLAEVDRASTRVTVTGDWLIWAKSYFDTIPSIRLTAARLSDLFVTVMPVPTGGPPPLTPYVTAPPPTVRPTVLSLVPPPLTTGAQQTNPTGSRLVLAWEEFVLDAPATPNFILRALDRVRGRTVLINEGAPFTTHPVLDGTVLAWSDTAHGQLLAQDVATGQRVTLSTTGAWRLKAVHDSEVAWVESSLVSNGTSSRIMVQALNDASPRVVATLTPNPPQARVIGALALSAQYVAWVETDPFTGARGFTIQTLNRQTGARRQVATGTMERYTQGPLLALVGSTLYWTDPQLHMLDLATGVTRILETETVFGLVAREDVVVWQVANMLRGQQLPNGVPQLLVSSSILSPPTLFGDWLVYQAVEGLLTVPLNQLFVHLGATPPTVPPTAPAITPIPPTPGGLTIPPPPAGRWQFGPQASARYLAWTDGPTNQGAGELDVLGLDLATGQQLTIASGQGEQMLAGLSDSFVVWLDGGAYPGTPRRDIYGKDLANGQIYPISLGGTAGYGSQPAVANQSVAWLAVEGQNTHLRLRATPTGPIEDIATLPGGFADYPFGPPALSSRYLAWSELTGSGPHHLFAYRLKVYDRSARQIREVTSGVMNSAGVMPELAVRDSTPLLFWTDQQLHYQRLDIGASGLISRAQVHSLRIYGDTLVWEENDSYSLWGLRLTNSQPYQLIGGSSSYQPVSPAVAGDWLVWQVNNHLETAWLANLLPRR